MAKRKAQKRFYLIALGSLIAVLAVMLFVIIFSMNKDDDQPVSSVDANQDVLPEVTPNPEAVFAQGVTIDGVSIGGKTYEEGLAEIEKALSAKIEDIAYVLKDGDVSKPISSEDMRVSDDMEAVLQAALKYSPGQLGDEEELSLAAGQDFKISLSVDREALVSKINSFAGELNKAPVEATVTPVLTEDIEARFEITDSEDGLRAGWKILGLQGWMKKRDRALVLALIELESGIGSLEDFPADAEIIHRAEEL